MDVAAALHESETAQYKPIGQVERLKFAREVWPDVMN